MPGVLEGVTVLEFAGIGPGPFACMMLADHGARVIRIERPGLSGRHGVSGQRDILNRSRERIGLDLKDPAAITQIREMVKTADVIIDANGDGRMDDLNRDGRLDLSDTRVILRSVERVEKQYPMLVGGLGLYHAMGASGPFAHVDVRGTTARWQKQ